MKHTLLLCLVAFPFIQLPAQTTLAAKAGINYSSARAYFSDGKHKTGYVAGVNASIRLKTRFEGLLHFSTSISYQSRGFIIHSLTSTDQTRNFIHYAELNPQLSIDLPAGKDSRFSLAAGPTASLAIAGNEKFTAGNVTTTHKMTFSTVNEYGLFDFGLCISAGYQVRKFFIEAAYQPGFVNINNNAETDHRNIRNRNISLSFGYQFRSFK